jgi:hypothetical protein
MSFRVETTASFRIAAKQLIKKYPSLPSELQALGLALSQNPEMGQSLGNQCFKIRMAIRSKGKGKSGGARIITHTYLAQSTVYLLTIFDKSDQSSLSDKQISELLKQIR